MSGQSTTKITHPDGTVMETTTEFDETELLELRKQIEALTAENVALKSGVGGMRPEFDSNICLLTDSYKITHFLQYPPKTEYVYSYFESRGGKFPEIVFFGLQYFIKRYLMGPVVTHAMVDQAKDMVGAHLMNSDLFNEAGWRYIVDKHGGCLPLVIKSVPEGTVVPAKNVLFTMENTDPECYWLTNYMETLLVQIWHPMTVCTNSRCQKKIIADALKATDSWGPVGTMFKLHDFGYRGVSSVESAATGGAAHLVNFSGTDTMAGYMCARQYYNEPMAGFSIPAAEHSTITSWGRDGETEAFRNMLVQYKDSPLVAVVSDSYDIIKACTDIWGGTLKEMVKERGANGGQLVVRPDSGDPATIVVEVLEALGKSFAEDCSTTSTGHKLLPPYLRVIQGDGVSIESLTAILENMIKHNWAADNLAFGSGGALLQKLNRDTQKCAFKCSAAIVDGVERCVYKDPITDKGKLSKKGRLSLENIAYPATEEAFLASGIFGKFDAKLVGTTSIMTVCEGKGNPANNMLVEVFRDGVLTKEWSFAEVRALAELDVVKEMTAKAAAPPEGEAPKLSA